MKKKMRYLRVCLLACTSLAPPLALAGFALNFSYAPAPIGDAFGTGAPDFSCGPGISSCGSAGVTGSPAEQTVVTIPGQGQYFRNVIGDPSTGFAYEFYTPYKGFGVGGHYVGGGMERGAPVDPWTGSANITSASGDTSSEAWKIGNMENPFGAASISGTGTSDPGRTAFRLVIATPLSDGMKLEVYKPLMSRKAVISQTINNGSLSSEFSVDMRDLLFTDKSTAAQVVINQKITDPSMPMAGAGDFTMALAQDSTAMAGRYSYTPGGWVSSSSPTSPDYLTPADPNAYFVKGTYSYAAGGGSFDPYAANWKSYFNAADNPACTSASSTRALSRPLSCPNLP